MTRIRVNTDDLRASAKVFSSTAENIGKAGDEILLVALSLPSYDGQLSGPAKKAGFEIQSQYRELKTSFATDSEALLNIAKSFEEVDNGIIDELKKLWQGIVDWLSGPKIDRSTWGPPWDTTETHTEPGPLGRTMTVTTETKILPDGSKIIHITQSWAIIPTPEESKQWKSNEEAALYGLNLLLGLTLPEWNTVRGFITNAVVTAIPSIFNLLKINIPDDLHKYMTEVDDQIFETQESYEKISPDGTHIDSQREVDHRIVKDYEGNLRTDTTIDSGWHDNE